MNRIKDFLHFAKTIAKDSTILLSKYVFVGIFWIILTLIANKFELHELTYFNAVFGIMCLASIIPFGISLGISIFINQNIDKAGEAEKYIKLGFMMNLIASIVLVAILFFFKSFIFKYFIIVDIKDNYLFFHMMLPVIFMIMTCDYFSDTFKVLKEGKTNLLFCAVDFGITLLTIIVVSLFGKLSLYTIAFCYLLTKVIFIPGFLVYAFRHLTKKVKLDLLQLHKVKISFDFKTIKTICLFGFSEIIWNIAFILSSLILLKNSELVYNSYNYFESVLDILNGVYFSFIAICGISICNSLGRKDLDRAYKEGKYSIFLTILIWLVIFISVMIFKNFILSGMNTEIISVGNKILIAYMFIQLLRFIDWAIFTYITSSGGEIKLMFYLNFVWLAYFAGLFTLSNFIHFNDVILILLIGLDGLVNCIVGIWFFRSKKWLTNLSN